MTEKNKLISRIIDREDRPKDWARLDGVARQDPTAWRDLLFALRDDAEVRQAVDAQLAVADSVALPATSTARANGWSTATVMAVGGWLAATVLALLWLGSTLSWADSPAAGPGSGPGPGPGAALADLVNVNVNVNVNAPDATGADANAAGTVFAAQMVVGELPRLMVQARPIAGREEVEVIYIRRTLERVLVKKAYRLAVDESGQPFTVPTDLTAYMPPRIY